MPGIEAASGDCINEEILQKYLDGTLDDTDAGFMEEHVQSCVTCRGLLATLVDSCAQPMWLLMAGREPNFGRGTSVAAASTETISEGEQRTRPVIDVQLPGGVAGPEIYGFAPIRFLGSGSSGEVWEARDVLLNRAVAIKLLRYASPTVADVHRLMNEAQALGRLNHPGIVTILKVSNRDLPAIVMQLVRGPSLKERLGGTAICDQEAASLVADVADAIHHAHQNGVIHRDLKPSNILLKPCMEGVSTDVVSRQPLSAYRPMISDFGTARLADASGATFQGQMLGTPAYMAPEQVAGDPSLITAAVDIYSLGVVLYELLTGRPPYVTTNAEVTLQLVQQCEPISPRQLQPLISRDLENICLKCLSRDPRDRYATAEAVRDDLKRFLNGQPVTARPLRATDHLYRWARRNRSLATSLVLVLLLVLGICLQSILFGYRQRGLVREAREAEKTAESAQRVARDSEVRALQSSEQLRQQLSKTVRSMDDMINVFGDLDVHDQSISAPARQRFFAIAIRAYEDYLAFNRSNGNTNPADVKVVVRVCWLRERLQPGSASEQDLKWVAEMMQQGATSEDTEESLDLEARYREVEAMHAVSLGRHTEAAESWNRVVTIIDRLSALRNPPPLQLNRHYRLKAGILMNCAGQQLAAGDFAKAAEAAEQAIRVMGRIERGDPEYAADVVRQLEYSFSLAQLLYGAGLRSRAVSAIDRALSLSADTQFVDPSLRVSVADLQQRLKDYRAVVTGESNGFLP